VNTTRSLHIFIYIKMEDSSDQQWSWALAVGAVFAMYGVCSPPTHPSKLTLPAFWISEPAAWFALAEAKFPTSNITS
jgi:hypothetical protein